MKSRKLAFLILTLFTISVLLVIADITLQWSLKIPSRFLKEVIRFEPSLAPPKRLVPNKNLFLIGALKEFAFHVTTNSEGFRRTTPYQLNDGTNPSIVLLGDSQTFGVGVDDHETIASFLSAKLGKPVLNTGCPGYNNIEQLLLTNSILKRYQPDFFILLFFPGNDPYENFTNRNSFLKAEQAIYKKQPKRFHFSLGNIKSYLIRHSAIYYLSTLMRSIEPINDLLYKFKLVEPGMPKELHVYMKNPEGNLKTQFWEITDKVLLKIRHRINQSNSQLIIVMVPDKYQIDETYWQQWTKKYKIQSELVDLLAPNQHLKQFCEGSNISFLDLTAKFQFEHKRGAKIYWKLDHHLRERGNQIIAESIVDYLQK